ncbi:hypothetical protein CD149_04890 [Staphylococcus condimenti]|uniref:Uncharacterized protein n=1 Tax=Staphylococcus condimenti TaxID=70255 RepID=A0A143P9J6_9STAP|nr:MULTISPECIES: hypothetical protein [Staphylococcus]AMY05040.1 hypothetical protein A4G25_03460 [Staphylococcus condimenti]APR61288.1 hypothetical protein BTZ13_08720 [Staphylococcus condimenti]MDK8645140.1 hypothetical protein [Staphylococcus condimenti]OFP02359.1 hypothetical protein HMPREF3007_03705 [Staphylococcus sp. HMSC065E08]PNZ61759.1 hypothetical protein CD149_04890 [Staphylococcus condimenti]
MNKRVAKSYKEYYEKFGEMPPAPYMSTLSDYEKDEAINQRIRHGKPFEEIKYWSQQPPVK